MAYKTRNRKKIIKIKRLVEQFIWLDSHEYSEYYDMGQDYDPDPKDIEKIYSIRDRVYKLGRRYGLTEYIHESVKDCLYA